MSDELVCPRCGEPVPIDVPEEPISDEPGRTIEIVIPPTVAADDEVLVTTTEADQPPGDALAGGASPLASFASNAASMESGTIWAVDPLQTPSPGGSSEAPGGPYPAPEQDVLAAVDAPANSWAALGLDLRPSSREEPASRALETASAHPATTTIRPESDTRVRVPSGGPRRTSGTSVLLRSYASAVTLACVWLVVQLRGRPEPFVDQPVADSGRSAPLGYRDGRAYPVAPVPVIPSHRRTTLGEPLRIGDLEFTPLDVTSASVTLQRDGADGQRTTRDGGGGVLVMSVRLRNLSDDQVFAPLDEGFVRDPERGLPESFIEAGRERIYSYALPVESAWSVVGQEFRDLRPGESFETILVSDREALARTSGTMTWRLRLRAGASRTEIVGVTFRRDEIR